MDAWSDLYSFRSLWRHYRTCRRNKRNTLNALRFEIDAEANLLALAQDLRDHRYQPGRSICFVTEGPKPREVFAADFRDRIVHHLLVHHLEPVFEPRFIHDSYACRSGKGTLAASDRLMAFLRRVTANGHRAAWALKLDVASFFASIHKQTLYEIIARRIRDPEILWLTRVVLFHDPTADYTFRSRGRRTPPPGDARYPVARHKSLFGKNNERGLPIGNLTSQFWANVYLNELDQFVKRTLKCRYYVRYVDDMVLLSQHREELACWRGEIERFLRTRLKLDLRAERQDPMPVAAGVDFVGWKTWWNHRLVRRQTLGNLRGRLGDFERRAVRRAFAGAARRIDIGGRAVPALRQTLASYAGHLRHGAARGDWLRIWAARPWLRLVFECEGWQVRERWARVGCTGRFADHYRRIVWAASDDCLAFMRVGRYVEFYGPQRVLAERALGLRRIYLPRAGYAFAAGFPVWLGPRFVVRALRVGIAVVLVKKGGTCDTGSILFRPILGARSRGHGVCR